MTAQTRPSEEGAPFITHWLSGNRRSYLVCILAIRQKAENEFLHDESVPKAALLAIGCLRAAVLEV